MLIGLGLALTLARRVASAAPPPPDPPQTLLLLEDGFPLLAEDGATLTLEEPA
jgi:hypothetical protein